MHLQVAEAHGEHDCVLCHKNELHANVEAQWSVGNTRVKGVYPLITLSLCLNKTRTLGTTRYPGMTYLQHSD
jgi:hypothetical protein